MSSTLGTLTSLLQLKRFEQRWEYIALYPGSFSLVHTAEREMHLQGMFLAPQERVGVYAGACCQPVCVYGKHYKGVYHGIPTTLLFIGPYTSTIQVAIEDT